jgi:hypothetical protein
LRTPGLEHWASFISISLSYLAYIVSEDLQTSTVIAELWNWNNHWIFNRNYRNCRKYRKLLKLKQKLQKFKIQKKSCKKLVMIKQQPMFTYIHIAATCKNKHHFSGTFIIHFTLIYPETASTNFQQGPKI